jgi:phosphatidylglycerol lysyltransferase
MGLVDASLWRQIPRAMAQVSPQAIGGAVLWTLISFWAIGRYDAVAHRHLRSGIAAGPARLSGTIAIALSQTLGLGIFTGALARWRMMPDLGMPTALRLSGFVCLSFMVSLVILLAAACVFLPSPAGTFWPALAVLPGIPVLALALLVCPCVTLRGRLQQHYTCSSPTWDWALPPSCQCS